MHEPVEIDLEIKRITALGVRVHDGDITVWLPRAKIDYEGEIGDTVAVTMPQWLAEEAGLV